MKILITGAAGFIGYFACEKLLAKGYEVIGLDSINSYYSVDLKFDRLGELGIKRSAGEIYGSLVQSSIYENFRFIRLELEDNERLSLLFEQEQFDVVCNLAAQAGVRYSIENPKAYINSNIIGFSNIIENCHTNKIKHLVYASSSSVYGLNTKIPFETTDRVDHPISLYAATKKSNELIAYTYSHLHSLPTTGLRFFTVYGPWGRPDMAMFLFTDAIVHGKPIEVFNHGEMERDFTYIDDIIEGLVRIVEKPVTERLKSGQLYKLYNIGNNRSVKLTDFIKALEDNLNTKAKKEMLPIQPGDVKRTWANVDDLMRDYDYKPDTPIEEGIQKFVDWYKAYYKL